MNISDSLKVLEVLVREPQAILALLDGAAQAHLRALLAAVETTDDHVDLLQQAASVVLQAGESSSLNVARTRGVSRADVDEANATQATLQPRNDQIINRLQQVRELLDEALGPLAEDRKSTRERE